MFTGIVQGTAEIVGIKRQEKFQTHSLRFPQNWLEGLEIGASVAHNGVCLTVTRINGQTVDFDLMQITLDITNLGKLAEGDRVNIERAARIGDEIGGHLMSGHIMATAEIASRSETPTNCELCFQIPKGLDKYILAKGFIGIDGISLTVTEVNEGLFSVNLIPETLSRTNLQWRQPGERVNIEIDPQTQAVVETVERVMAQRKNN